MTHPHHSASPRPPSQLADTQPPASQPADTHQPASQQPAAQQPVSDPDSSIDIPERMRAAYVRSLGGPENIEVGSLHVPRPGPTDVLVRMLASEVNHVDLFVRSGAYPTHTPFPFVMGRDVVGTVVTTGAGVSVFRPGDRVWSNSLGVDGRQGTFAEYVLIPADRTYPLPENVTAEDAAVVLHGAATAQIGLFRRAHLRAGQTVFVAGGGGAVGSAVTQIATDAGARVVVSASTLDEQWCRSCGAEHVIDYRDPQQYQRLEEAAPQGVDLWWDNSGRHDFDFALPLLNDGATMVLMSGMQARPALPVGQVYTRDVTIRGFAISNAGVDDLADAAATINRMLAAGNLRGRTARTYKIDEARRAHEAIASERLRGRILIHP